MRVFYCGGAVAYYNTPDMPGKPANSSSGLPDLPTPTHSRSAAEPVTGLHWLNVTTSVYMYNIDIIVMVSRYLASL